MNKENNLLNNNDDEKEESKVENDKNSAQVENNDEIINVELYDEILSSLFNSLSNSIVRNEIKINESILKYLELQISNLFFLETELAKELNGKNMAKDFLQLTADITNLTLSVTKSHVKTRIQIVEDRNLLIVTIINSCKGVERESLERFRIVDSKTLKNLHNQIIALSDFTTDEISSSVAKETDINQQNNLENLNNQNQTDNNLKNSNMNNFRNLNNMTNLTQLGLLPQHPAANPNFYPYLTKPAIIPKLKRILSGMLIFSSLLIVVTIITTMFVKGKLDIYKEEMNKDPVNFILSQTNNWLIIIMTVVLYISFAYVFMKPTKILREKYRISYFMLGLLFFWLVVTISYFFWQISDGYYENFFLTLVKKDDLRPINEVVKAMKNLPNFKVFQIFSIITAIVCVLPLLVVLILILINPRLDRNKIIRANTEYQNAVNAALNGQKYHMDSSLFDSDEPSDKDKKRKKVNFSGRF
ncbi:MAG: hypothetical protein ACRC8P_03340 [Spiroplasma sp.]